ncbi:MAG: sulfatase-like hydrolase/transferase, partial [Holophagae bacterium]|nr:sulfatase-like hydrolase/transferase [Holophagae bacterium]
KPFFLYFAINMPHYPLQGKTKWLEYYDHLPTPRREYAAFISTIDEAVGRLMDHLDALGLRENTIIIYQSDHGHSNEERTFGGGGSAGPFRGSKFSLFEGGIRIPAIISWKGHLDENATRDQIGVNVDWMPTIAELCGIDIPEQVLDGKSLAPLIRDERAETPHKKFFWHYPSVTMKKGEAQWAVRQDEWKLIVNGVDRSRTREPLDPVKDKYFLVNFDQDYTETRNFAEENPEKVRELQNLHDKWFKEIQN